MLAYSSIENMGILAIGTALGAVAMPAVIIHLIGHSFIKASFFLTSGNILKIYGTKKIKSVTGLLKIDNRTGWLWIISCLGITAFPPSVLFISEFLIVKTMIKCGHYWMCAGFLLLLTIIIYGLIKSIFLMSVDNGKNQEKINLDWKMYIPQIVLLVIAFVMGIYLPYYEIITQAVNAF